MDKIIYKENVYIQYDSNTFSNFSSNLFNIDYISKNRLIKSTIKGRATVFELEYENKKYILKHYVRGGFIANISYDKYLFTSLLTTRCLKEYNFLNKLHKKGLPVPKPVAIQVITNRFTYTADIITNKIDNEGTLHDFVSNQKMNVNLWENLKNTLEKFYQKNIYHSDLNARNIIIDKNNNFFILDFDNSYFFYKKKYFKKSIIRLERSLKKIKNYNNEMENIVNKYINL